ncbi:MAG: universal stress protein [Candidatus Gastranaerophilaceae bacterium]
MEVKNVLIAIDEFQFANHIVRTACKFFDNKKVIIHLINVLETNTVKSDLFSKFPDEYIHEESEKTGYNDLENFLGLHNFTYKKVHFSEGKAAEKILEYAGKNAIDMIVVGSHNKSVFEKFIIGSTSYKIARDAKCSVLIIKPSFKHDYSLDKNLKILAAVDGSEFINKISHNFIKFFDLTKLIVSIMYVRVPIETILPMDSLNYTDTSVINEESIKKAQEIIENAKHHFMNNGLFVDKLISKEGKPGYEIINEVKNEEYDLVAVGSHGKGFISSLIMGSVSTQVYENSKISVLIAKS